MSTAQNAQNVKARHYAALAARLNSLKTNLDETDRLMKDMSEHLLAMRSLAAANAAQFMAASRLVDHELSADNGSAEQDAGNVTSTP